MSDINYLYMNTTALAFLGDAVYETQVRFHLISTGKVDGDKLHREAVKFVRAEAQAEAIKAMMDFLSKEEVGLIKRARNKKISSKPKNADPVAYKWATALEALIGYHYLSKNQSRIDEIIHMAMFGPGEKNGEKIEEKQV
jgi:ribonuclease-3 family protein